MALEFDVVVIGTGSAGTAAATALRAAGKSVAIVDERPFGGTCMLRGCDPKKVLVAAARVVDDAQRYAALGIVEATPLHWPTLMRFKRTFTDPVPAQRERQYKEAGIRALRGSARFLDAQNIAVDGEPVKAQNIVIASGARTQHVAEGDDVLLTSEQFLELDGLPSSLLFVGGGYIAFEFAHVAARAGAKVTILHRGSQALQGFDPDLAGDLVTLTRSIGVDVQLDTTVESVSREGDGIVVTASVKGAKREFRAGGGVLAAGRVADIDRLALDVGHVERTKRGIKVDSHLQSTSNPHVYAAGDAADGGGLPLTPVAGYEGSLVAENILHDNRSSVDAAGLASMVYTIPPLGVVGVSEGEARKRGLDVEVHRGDMTDWFSTRHVAGRKAFYKSVIEKGSRKILGAAVLGPHAEEQINVFSLAIRAGLTADVVSATLFAYPTGSSDLEYMLT